MYASHLAVDSAVVSREGRVGRLVPGQAPVANLARRDVQVDGGERVVAYLGGPRRISPDLGWRETGASVSLPGPPEPPWILVTLYCLSSMGRPMMRRMAWEGASTGGRGQRSG